MRGHGPLWARIGARIMLAVIVLMVALVACALLAVAIPSSAHAQDSGLMPRAAVQHRLTLTREARAVWGLHAPVPAFAAQIHQESRWRADALSPVGAQGMTQFMPATARWISTIHPGLASRDVTSPTWAMRALVVYDRWLWDRVKADDDCEHMAYALSAYNGGLGRVYSRQRLSDAPGVCLGETCTINPGIAPASQRENEHYPRVILLQHQPIYRQWGPMLCL